MTEPSPTRPADIDALLAAARDGEYGPAAAHLAAAQAVVDAVAALRDQDPHRDALRAEALTELGNARRRVGDVPGAFEALLEAIALGLEERTRDPDGGRWLGLAHHRMAIAYDASNDLPHAIDHLRQAKAEYERRGDEQGVARVVNSLAIVFSRSGDLERALELFGRSLEQAEAVGDLRREASILSNMSITTRLLERFDEAVETARRAHALALETGDEDVAASTITNLALALAAIGASTEARATFERGLELHARHGDPFYEAEHLRCFAEFHLEYEHDDEALPLLGRSLELAEAGGATGQVQAAHERLAELWKRRGDLAKALEHFEAFHRATLEVERSAAARELQAQKWQAEAEMAQREAARARHDRAEMIVQLAELASEHRHLAAQAAELEVRSREDPLTGLANRRHFDERLAVALEQADILGEPVSLVLIDVDGFKAINDRLGHQRGDEVLRRIGSVLLRGVRERDLVARLGGEEFAVVLPGTDRPGGTVVAEKLRRAIEDASWDEVAPGLVVTVSAGVACGSEAQGAPVELLATADARLYAAKRGGRNRVVGHGVADAAAAAVTGG